MDPQTIFSRVRESGRRELTEQESRLVFEHYGIPVVDGEIVNSVKDARDTAEKMGYPVVLKIASPDILHKTEVGGVKTAIYYPEDVEKEFEEIIRNTRSSRPDARIDGIMIQPMERRGLEVIVGGVRDAVFDSIVMFGMGGILTEVLRDVTFGLAPVTKEGALEMVEGIQSRSLLHGYRGKSGIDTHSLADIIEKISRLMQHPEVAEIDANPVFAKSDGAVCVDARIILVNEMPVMSESVEGEGKEEESQRGTGSGPIPPHVTPGVEPGIKSIFTPSSVLLVGSSKIERRGRMASPKLFADVHYNLKNYFRGELTVFDIEERSIEELRDIRADTAVLALPSEESMECLTHLNVDAIIQIDGGFTASQRELYRKVITSRGIRMLGPTTILGVISPDIGFNTSFERDLMPEKGSIAVLSQSGGVGAILLDWAAYYGIGISRFAFMGEKLDVGDDELLSFLDSDPETKVICIYMEGVKDGRGFVKLVRGIRKPILVLKGGSSEASKKRAASHTASMAGSDEVFNAAFRTAGVLRVNSIEELFSGAMALISQPPMTGKNVAVVSNVGGPAILAADAIEKEGLHLASLGLGTRTSLSMKIPEIFPTPESVINPIDTIADARADRFETILEDVLQDPEVDGVMVINMLKSTFFEPWEASVIAEVAARSEKPVVDVPAGGADYFAVRDVLKDSGLPAYDLPEKAARVLRLLHDQYLALQNKR